MLVQAYLYLIPPYKACLTVTALVTGMSRTVACFQSRILRDSFVWRINVTAHYKYDNHKITFCLNKLYLGGNVTLRRRVSGSGRFERKYRLHSQGECGPKFLAFEKGDIFFRNVRNFRPKPGRHIPKDGRPQLHGCFAPKTRSIYLVSAQRHLGSRVPQLRAATAPDTSLESIKF